MNFLNSTYGFIINKSIIEYDIKSANTSIAKEYKLIPPHILQRMENMDKHERHVFFGLLMENNKELSSKIENAFNEVVKKFISQNYLKEDSILSIKRDAVFVIDSKITNPTVGNNITFRPKGNYQAYLHISPYEFYFSKKEDDYEIDIKGLSKDKDTRDKIIELHHDGILAFLKDVIDICSENKDCYAINSYMQNFIIQYKNKSLPIDFYREFNQKSAFCIKTATGGNGYFNSCTNMEYIDILYNYKMIILPVLNLVCL